MKERVEEIVMKPSESSESSEEVSMNKQVIYLPDESVVNKLLEPLMNEFKSLKEKVDYNYNRLEDAINTQKVTVWKEIYKLEQTITKQKVEISSKLGKKLEENTLKINSIIVENYQLKKENQFLKDRLDQIETAELANNVIATGINEQKWEPYEATKQHVYDTIAASQTSVDSYEALEEAMKIDIAHCARIGKFKPNHSRPISVMFQCKTDKDKLI